jgi:hypothetical protein
MKYLTYIIFLVIGLLVGYFTGQNRLFKNDKVIIDNIQIEPSITPPTYVNDYMVEDVSEVTANYESSDSINDKYTMQQIGEIIKDREKVQTGQQVNFQVTIKNIGNYKKFITHLCLNFSPGTSFGCLRNVNFSDGEMFTFDSSMIFPNPGTYKIFLTWSQDHQNFYPLKQAKNTTISVY